MFSHAWRPRSQRPPFATAGAGLVAALVATASLSMIAGFAVWLFGPLNPVVLAALQGPCF